MVPDHDGEITASPELGKLLNQADKLAQQKRDAYVSSQTVLLAAIQGKDGLGKILNGFGVSAQA